MGGSANEYLRRDRPLTFFVEKNPAEPKATITLETNTVVQFRFAQQEFRFIKRSLHAVEGGGAPERRCVGPVLGDHFGKPGTLRVASSSSRNAQ